jgi:hypothetical protein
MQKVRQYPMLISLVCLVVECKTRIAWMNFNCYLDCSRDGDPMLDKNPREKLQDLIFNNRGAVDGQQLISMAIGRCKCHF